jgi:hypothetical protein
MSKTIETTNMSGGCRCGIPNCSGHPVIDGHAYSISPTPESRKRYEALAREAHEKWKAERPSKSQNRTKFILLALAYLIGLAATANLLFRDHERPKDFLLFAVAIGLWWFAKRRLLAAEWRHTTSALTRYWRKN